MKQIIVIAGLLISITLTSLSIITIQIKSSRTEELSRAVSAATKHTVKEFVIDQSKEITDNKTVIKFFEKILFTSINCDGDFQIDIIGIDRTNGLLDVVVTEKYKNVLGKVKTIQVRKTAIYE